MQKSQILFLGMGEKILHCPKPQESATTASCQGQAGYISHMTHCKEIHGMALFFQKGSWDAARLKSSPV